MLFCTAGGEPAKRGIVYGGRLARRTGAHTTLLFVDSANNPTGAPGPDGAPTHRMPPWIEKHLEEGANTLLNQGIRTQVKVRQGNVLAEVFEEVDEGNYDLIVVGAHLAPVGSRSGPDVMSEIVSRSDRPVLVVRTPANS